MAEIGDGGPERLGALVQPSGRALSLRLSTLLSPSASIMQEDNRRHQNQKALRQALDKMRRKQQQEAREALERWAAAPPPPIDDAPPRYRP